MCIRYRLLFMQRKSIELSETVIVQFLLIFIVATEGLQLHMFNRSTQFLDMVIDLGGVLLAWLIAKYVCSKRSTSSVEIDS